MTRNIQKLHLTTWEKRRIMTKETDISAFLFVFLVKQFFSYKIKKHKLSLKNITFRIYFRVKQGTLQNLSATSQNFFKIIIS